MKTVLIGLMFLGVGLVLGSTLEGDQKQSIQQLLKNWVGLELSTHKSTGDSQTGKGDTEKKILYWVAPMDPKYRRDKPGKSPMGMDLIPVYEGASGGDDSEVRISPSVVNNLGVRTAHVERRDLQRRIDTVGYVNFDETKMSHIHLRTDGWIDRLLVRSEGEHVEKGQLLFQFYSPALVNAQEEFLQAKDSKNRRLIKASKLRLFSLGLSKREFETLERKGEALQLVSVYAPQHGIVSHLGVREGMRIQPKMNVMTLAILKSVWLQTAVFERQADWVSLGGRAEARLSYMPGEVWKGKVDFIYPTLDPKTRTLKVRLQFDTPDKRMKPNMYAKVSIFGKPSNNRLVIPREAVIRSGLGERVVMALGEGRFKSRKIHTAMESEGWVEVISGLQEGEKVVTSAQFLIDSQASLKGSLDRMDAPETEQKSVDLDKDVNLRKEVKTTHQHAKESFNATGVLRKIIADERKIKLSHDPIPELKWPSMTMDFAVAEGVELGGLKTGQKVMFSLEKVGEFEYQIITIMANSEESKP